MDELSRPEAQAHFDWLMAEKEERKAQLTRLVRCTGGFDLVPSDEAARALDGWFANHLESRPDAPGEMTSRWHAVCATSPCGSVTC